MNTLIQLLTYFRIISGPVIFILILLPNYYGFALLLLLGASLTDFLDGYLARKYALTSIVGEVLDPIADKILITFTIIAIAINLGSIYVGFIGSLMLAREFWVSALRDLSARKGNSEVTKVLFMAKIKTAVQLLALCTFLFGLYLGNALIIFLANFFLFLALIITIETGLSYTISTFRK